MFSGFQDVALPDQCVNLMRESSSHFRKESSYVVPTNASGPPAGFVPCRVSLPTPIPHQNTLLTLCENILRV